MIFQTSYDVKKNPFAILDGTKTAY